MREPVLSTDGSEVVSFRDAAHFESTAGGMPILVVNGRRPEVVWNSWTPVSLWAALDGKARILGRDLRLELADSGIFVAEQGSRISCQTIGGGSPTAIGLLLPQSLVRRVALESGIEVSDESSIVFPEHVAEDPTLRAQLLAYARLARGNEATEERLVAMAEGVVRVLLQRQLGFEALVSRCPGRSARYRRQVLLRLLRARNHIEHAPGEDAALARLAAIAKMSPTHFLRLYHRVFDRTPHQHVIQTRLAMARNMVLATAQPISEIHGMLGFENRCAFSRVFKQHFGMAPTLMRSAAARSGAARLAMH